MPAITSLNGSQTLGASLNIERNLQQDKAITDFNRLRMLVGGNNASKTVQIKLVHTTDANRAMTFETKNWFGRRFSAEQKLVNTNSAILALVKKTGIPETSANFRHLKTYLDSMTAQQRAGSARGLHGLLEAIHREIQRKPAQPVATANTLGESLSKQGYTFDGISAKRGFIASGGHGQVYPESGSAMKGVLYKEFRELSEALLPKLRVEPDGKEGYTLKRNAPEQAAVSLRQGRVPHVASPLAYVIHDTYDEVFHTVSVDHLKDWAAEKGSLVANDSQRFMIAGQVLPKAEGQSGRSLKSLTLPDRQAIARQGLEALEAMAMHGHVHGDIKPDNLMYSTEKKQMQFIDFGGLTKKSKNDQSDRALGNPASQEMVIPSNHHPNGADGTGGYGHEADLYAFGLTLLNIYLPDSQQVRDLTFPGHAIRQDIDAMKERLQDLRTNVALVKPGSPEDLAVLLMDLSLQQSEPLTGRLGAGDGRLEALWQRIHDHPVMAQRAAAPK